jgi:hypothetical protein
MNRAVDPAASQKRRIRRIYNRVGRFLRDVGRSIDFDDLLVADEYPHQLFDPECYRKMYYIEYPGFRPVRSVVILSITTTALSTVF